MSATLKLAAIAILALGIVGCSGLNRRRAEKAIDAGQYDVADRLLQDVLRRNPGDAEAHLLAGKMLLKIDRTEVGDRELAMAAAADPSLKPRIARLYFDIGSGAQADDRLQHYLATAAKFDPQIAPTISDWVLRTAKSLFDRRKREKALEIAQAAVGIDHASRTRLGAFLIEGAKTCAEQNEDGLASQYTAAACAVGPDQVKAAARMMAQLKSQGRDRSPGTGSWDTARCLCQAIQANPSLTRDDEEFAWLMYSGVFQGTGEYLKLFPNGKHAAEARSGLRKTRTAPSPCVEILEPGVPGGIPGGVIGGVLGNDSPPPPRAAVPQVQTIRVGQNVERSNLITEVPPVYPALAKAARIQGTVRFTVRIGTVGRVESLQLVSGHPLLVAAAQDAVKQWVYRPTLLNGEPVRVETQVEVVFRLQ
jgi:TonB family protein